MVRRALLLGGFLLLPLGVAGGVILGGPAAGVSAGIGVAVILLNFAAHGLSLAWAAGVSITAVQAVALGGFVVRLGAVAGLLFALTRTSFFSPVAFGLAAAVATVLLLVYEARLVLSGVGSRLDLPADPAAAAAARSLRVGEDVG